MQVARQRPKKTVLERQNDSGFKLQPKACRTGKHDVATRSRATKTAAEADKLIHSLLYAGMSEPSPVRVATHIASRPQQPMNLQRMQG